MKKIFILSTVAIMGLASCSDYDDQFNIGSQISNVKNGTRIVLAGADYATIAGLTANKELAEKLDAESGTTAYTEALEQLGSNKYFGTLITPDLFLPAFIHSKYVEADAGSKFKVTYNMYTGKSQYLADFDQLKGEYTLKNSDYATAWDGTSSATYLTPKTVAKLPAVVKAAYPDAQEGDIVVANYAYSNFEPAGNTESGDTYTKISDVTANTDGGEYTVKGIVCATYSRGFLLTDNTGYILVFKSGDVNIGDEVSVAGTTTRYGGLMQFQNTAEVNMIKAGKEPNYKQPAAKTLVGADFDAYAENPYVAYITFKGNLSISGNYYNVTVEGTEKQGSLANVPAGMVDESLNGKDVTVYGYSIGATGKNNKYLNVMLTGISEASAAASAKAGVARAASNNGANASVVLRYDGSEWKEYTTDAAKVIAAQPEWYDLIGSATVSKTSSYFPVLLQREYPFASDGQKVAVVYRKSSSSMDVVEYTYKTATGWEESKEYKQKTTSFLQGENGFEVLASTYFEESLLGDEGGFVAFDVAKDASLNYVWSNTTQYGWKASAYTGGSSKASESWLVSPAINLSEADSPQLVFDEAMNKLGNYNPADYLKVRVSADFDGSDVKSATWETLEVNGGTDGQSWSFCTINPISLAKYTGKTIHVAFVYISTSEVAATYEVKNVVVQEAE